MSQKSNSTRPEVGATHHHGGEVTQKAERKHRYGAIQGAKWLWLKQEDFVPSKKSKDQISSRSQ